MYKSIDWKFDTSSGMLVIQQFNNQPLYENDYVEFRVGPFENLVEAVFTYYIYDPKGGKVE